MSEEDLLMSSRIPEKFLMTLVATIEAVLAGSAARPLAQLEILVASAYIALQSLKSSGSSAARVARIWTPAIMS